MPLFNQGGFQFYNPSDSDWGGSNPFPGTPAHDWMAELERQAYYGNWLGRQNLQGMNNQSDVARSMYNRMHQGYQAGLFDNPDDQWVDYLNRNQYKMRDIMASMDPASRGLNSSQFTGGSRWQPRSF